MQMIVLVVFAVVLSFGAPGGVRIARSAPLGWTPLLACLIAYVLTTAGITWWLTRLGLNRLMSGGAFAPTVHRQRRRLMAVGLWLIAGMIALVLVGATDQLRMLPGAATVPLVDEMLILGVFFLAAVAYWRISFRFDRAVRWQVEQDLMLAGLPVRAGWNSREHLAYSIRHHFLFIAVPVGLIVLAHECVDLIAPRVAPASAVITTVVVAKVVAVGVVFFVSPVLLVRVWRTRPMPDGELRRRLERLCDRIGLRYHRILIWDTGGVLANAAVMGLHRWVRYILISDALLEQMDDREIVAVFGHEAGHVKHHHIGYFLFAMVAVLLLCMATVSAAGIAAGRVGVAAEWVAIGEEIAMVVLVCLAIGVGFGWLSRRFERQADVYGAWCAGVDGGIEGTPNAFPTDLALGGPWFIAALENIARLNGMSRHGRNWRHGSIETRVQFLADWIAGGRNRGDFDRGVIRLKRIGWIIAVAGVLGAATTWRHWW